MTERRKGEEKKGNKARAKEETGRRKMDRGRERERENEENDESRGQTLAGTMTPFTHGRDDRPPSSMET